MRGAKQNWSLDWQLRHPQDQPRFEIDPSLGAVSTMIPAASREDSRPQAILKFQPRNTDDDKVKTRTSEQARG